MDTNTTPAPHAPGTAVRVLDTVAKTPTTIAGTVLGSQLVGVRHPGYVYTILRADGRTVHLPNGLVDLVPVAPVVEMTPAYRIAKGDRVKLYSGTYVVVAVLADEDTVDLTVAVTATHATTATFRDFDLTELLEVVR